MRDECFAQKQIKVAFVGADPAIKKALVTVWPEPDVVWTFFENGKDATGLLLTSPPDILLCCIDLPDMSGLTVTRLLKGENVYSKVPVILCLNNNHSVNELDWAHIEIDEFIEFPCSNVLLRARLELARNRGERTLDANPLTKLPGNTTIIRHTQGLIDKCEDFALGYCDLDFFKSFNDKYGFSRGDEVLMMSARIILNTIKGLSLDFFFVGHVGGDDYIFIVPYKEAEMVCKKIITSFDGIIPQFYDEDDRKRGSILSVDRQGIPCTFPLMGISIAVVFNKDGNLRHYGEASQLAALLKKKAKETVGSSYVLDRRQHPTIPS